MRAVIIANILIHIVSINAFAPPPVPILHLKQQSQHESNFQCRTVESPTAIFAENRKASIQLSMPQIPSDLSPTSILDYILSVLTSDLSSIVLGSVGILLALSNRLSSIDYEASSIALNEAVDMGMQSRMDLLAVFSAGAVLLNGVSKLDVTSALAESVVLEGTYLDKVLHVDSSIGEIAFLEWALFAARTSTPAKSAVVLAYCIDDEIWKIVAVAGCLPADEDFWQKVPEGVPTPILNRLLKEGQRNKETYLPTLQALPGRAEFTYLPQNTQEVLMLPIEVKNGNAKFRKAALVLGGDCSKTFTPRDVAWCQVLVGRMGQAWSS